MYVWQFEDNKWTRYITTEQYVSIIQWIAPELTKKLLDLVYLGAGAN